MPAPRYVLINAFSAGIVAWDTQSDTAYSGNPVVPSSFRCYQAQLAISGDGQWAFARGNSPSTSATVAKINTATLSYSLIPANWPTGAGATASQFLAANQDGSEVYLQIVDGTAPDNARVLAVNTTTGNVRAATGYGYGGVYPEAGVLSYDGSFLFTAYSKNSLLNGFREITLSSMADAILNNYTNVQGIFKPVGLSADGTVLYGLYNPTGTTTALVGIRISDGFEVGRYTYSVGTSQSFPVLSFDRQTCYIARIASPFNILVVDMGTFTLSRTDPFVITTVRGSFDSTGRYIYYGSNPVVKYDSMTGTYQSFSSGFGGTLTDSILTPAGFPFSAGGSGPSTPTGLGWDGVCRGASARLFWDMMSGVNYYTLYRDGQPVYIGPLISFTDSDLRVGQIYTYTITATNGSGTSAPSDSVTVTPCVPGGGDGDCCNWARIEAAPPGTWNRIETPCSE